MCVFMKLSIFAFIFVALASAAVSARAQVVPAANANSFTLGAGGLGAMYQPDYAGEGIAQTSPYRLFGAGAFVDARFNRWAQIEGESHWMRFNPYLGITENSYLIGPRIPITTIHNFTPYGKVLVGFGSGSFLNGHSFVVAYGGGVDYRLGRRFTLRAIDFEYQQWTVTPTLWPYGGSVGVSYKIF
jgi:hypothetical protein